MEATREQVQAAINSERAYQQLKWGTDGIHDNNHSVGDFILFMEDYLAEAIDQAARMDYETADHTLRKVAALGVACLEQHPRGVGNDRRERVFEIIWGVTDEEVTERATDDLIDDDLESIRTQLLEVRRLQTREAGDSPSIHALIKLLRFTFAVMQTNGAPLRELPVDPTSAEALATAEGKS